MSREKEKVVPREREKLKAWPWLASVWQKAKHWVAIEEETASHTVASNIFDYLKVVNRPGVAGAVLQTPSSLIN